MTHSFPTQRSSDLLYHPCLHRAIKSGKSAACTETGIVDQYVDRQLARLEFGGEAGDGVFLGEIGDDDVRRHIVAAGDQFGELLEPVAAACDEDAGMAALRTRQREMRAGAGGGAGARASGVEGKSVCVRVKLGG